MSVESRLVELGLSLPAPVPGSANRVGAVVSGNVVYTSGHGPALCPDGWEYRGKVGAELTVEQGVDAARLTGVALLATLRDVLGSLDRVTRVVKVLGMVNCAPGMNQMSKVIDGCSDLLVEVFGPEVGRHARSAVGMAELPLDLPVEIELIAQVGDYPRRMLG
jgi:enamine deaminase RidA (YjgF/YER057c/UK114 family)